MAAILTAEDVVRRIAAECAYVDERGGVGIRLQPAAAIVAVRRAIPPAVAATAPASAGEAASPALSDAWLFFLDLTFATRKPLNQLASVNT
jgi:hypothetical protein